MKASLTTETALIMPVVIFTLLASIYLTAHIHNRACLSANAGEQAISGHMQEDPQLFAAGRVSTKRSDSSAARSVETSAGTFHFSGTELWPIRVNRRFRKCHPVKLIRAKHAVT